MLNEIIETLREKLNQLVENNAPYEEIYKVSTELDKYITMYYEQELAK